MGEKEIKPASQGTAGPVTTAPEPQAPPARQAGGGSTTERPNTGTAPPAPSAPGRRPGDEPSGRSGGFEGDTTWPDEYKMEHSKSGEWTLKNPDGTSAKWDPDEQQWIGPDDKAMPASWFAGHAPGRRD